MNAHHDHIGDSQPSTLNSQLPRKWAGNRANTRVPGLRLPASYVVTAARRRKPTDAKAMRWLLNYAGICGREMEDFTEPFGLTLSELREALTEPFCEAAPIAKLTAGVRTLRREFELRLDAPNALAARELESPFRPGSALYEGYGPVAATHVAKTVRSALNATLKRGTMSEIIGLTRIGKTTPAVQWFLRNLDEAVYFSCPETMVEQDFLTALARAACSPISGGSYTGAWARERIESAFGAGGYRMIIVDEAHNVWRSRSKTPARLEFLRRLRDQYGVCVALLATPQFTEHLATALAGDSRWAPGQYDGRAEPYHLPQTLTDGDIAAVARLHAPDFEAALIDELVSFAKRSHGYLGAMIAVIARAREAFDDYPDKPRPALFAEVTKRQENGRRAELKAAGKLVASLRIGGAK